MRDMKKRKTVLLISNMYPSKKFPHYGVFVKNMEDVLLNNNYKIRKVVLKKSTNKLLKLISYLCFYFKIICVGIFSSYNCIYSHYASHTALPLLIIKKIKPKCKIVMNVHGNDIVPEDEHDEKYIPLTTKILSKSDKIISPSKYFENVLINQYSIKKDKIYISPSGGIDLSVFFNVNIKDAKKHLNLDQRFNYIGYVSRIEKDKGWDTYIKAIKILDEKLPENYKFLIVGNGEQYNEMLNLIKEYKIENRIILKTYMKQEDLRYVYSSLDIFCFPTYRKSESLGLVGLEAMACETIVLAANNYGPQTYINNEFNGVFFKPNDFVDLSNQVLKILEFNEKKSIQIKKNGLNTAKEFSKIKISKDIIKFFNQI